MNLNKKITAFLLSAVLFFCSAVNLSAAQDSKKAYSQDNSALPNWFENSASEVTSLTFLSNKISLKGEGAGSQLVVFSQSGKNMNTAVTFTSSDSDTASVGEFGAVTAHKNGIVTITAALKSNPEISAQCTVTVSGIISVSQEITLSASSASLYVGNKYVLAAESELPVKWSSSDTSVASVSDGIITANAAGKAVITADNGYNALSCTITVTKGAAVNISSKSDKLPVGQTLFLNSTTTGAKWKSSDTSIATVEQMTDKNGQEFAFVLAKKTGTTTITVSTSKGASTCLLNVTAAEPIRFAYTTPNSALSGEMLGFVAITDLSRTAVKFEYELNGKKGTVEATEKEIDGNTIIWTAYTELNLAGTYNVTAYAKTADSDYKTCSNGKTTAFVTSTENTRVTSCEVRRVSDRLMSMLATWEGFRKNVELDDLTGSDPTVGYGRVVSVGNKFYNSLTKNEAMAYLYETVNTAGYADAVNEYMLKNYIRFNQQQYDSLVLFVYNFGTYALSYFDDINGILLNTYPSSGGLKAGAAGKITGTEVRLLSGPSTDYTIITEMDINTPITLLSTEIFNDNWYYIQLSDGRKGYVYGDYASFTSSTGARDLNNINKQEYIKTFMPYHHAGDVCYWGLIYRRVDEIEMFFEGDYIEDGRLNKYGYSFTCRRDSDYYI